MSDTNFTDLSTPVVSSWLNDLNSVVYRLLGGSAGPGGSAPTTTGQIIANLGAASLAGSSGQVFAVAPSAAGTNQAVPRIQADAAYAPISGSTQYASQAALIAASFGRLIGVQQITSNGTYTSGTHNPTFVIVESVGGGGGGGGASSGTYSVGGGGGGGGYCLAVISSGALLASEAITIGAGGAGGASTGGVGGTGGTTSFGVHCFASGGTGGAGAKWTSANVSGGGSGGASSGGLIQTVGDPGMTGLGLLNSATVGGTGGSSFYGGGSAGPGVNGAGISAAGYGGGGSGAGEGTHTGGNGAPGMMLIWEYR